MNEQEGLACSNTYLLKASGERIKSAGLEKERYDYGGWPYSFGGGSRFWENDANWIYPVGQTSKRRVLDCDDSPAVGGPYSWGVFDDMSLADEMISAKSKAAKDHHRCDGQALHSAINVWKAMKSRIRDDAVENEHLILKTWILLHSSRMRL